MKKSVLIGLLLAVTSSSAYAYVITSQKKTTTFTGSPNTSYYIKCNSGVSKTVVSNPVSWTSTIYNISGQAGEFPNVDSAAKKACNE